MTKEEFVAGIMIMETDGCPWRPTPDGKAYEQIHFAYIKAHENEPKKDWKYIYGRVTLVNPVYKEYLEGYALATRIYTMDLFAVHNEMFEVLLKEYAGKIEDVQFAVKKKEARNGVV